MTGLEKIFEKAVIIYGNGGVLGDYLRNPKGDFGDMLAQFIIREALDLYDSGVSEEENMKEIMGGLNRAIEQLQVVRKAIGGEL
jgi:hypothetical protein